MKKILFCAVAFAVALAACNENDDSNNKSDDNHEGEKTVAVTGVTLSQATASLTVGGTLKLTATVLPENATNKNVYWSAVSYSGATTVSDDGLVTVPAGAAAGTATITVTTLDGGYNATCVVTVLSSGPIAPITIGSVTWAAYNVDDYQTFAARPDMYTKFYRWNRDTAWAATGSVSGWGGYSYELGGWTINPCPEGWRLPHWAHFNALSDAGSTWADANTRGNAVAGRFYGANHANCTLPNNMANCIFLPAVGWREFSDGTLVNQGETGYYWSSVPYDRTPGYSPGFHDVNNFPQAMNNKASGLSLRCIK